MQLVTFGPREISSASASGNIKLIIRLWVFPVEKARIAQGFNKFLVWLKISILAV